MAARTIAIQLLNNRAQHHTHLMETCKRIPLLSVSLVVCAFSVFFQLCVKLNA